MDPDNFRDFKLVERKQLSHNVAKFKFALPTPTSVLGLPIGQHISCKFVCLPVLPSFLYALNFELSLFTRISITFWLDRGKDSLGEEVVKPYTPTTLDSDVGYFELVIKVRIHRCL